MNRIFVTYKRSFLLYALFYLRKGFHSLLKSTDFFVKISVKKKFKRKINRKLNLVNPHLYNDKIQWLKLNFRGELGQKCADKYRVRDYLKQKGCQKYLNDIYEYYTKVNDINLEVLPKSFVLKGTHGSGFNIICQNKYDMDWKKEFKKMDYWLNTNYFWSSNEYVYKNITPGIVCEKYLYNNSNQTPPNDYKFFCFSGVPKLICVDFDRFDKHKRNFYDVNWNFLDIQISRKLNSNNKSIEIDKPDNLDEMIALSKKLSQDFEHVRVDLYSVNNKIYFGELTFFHASGLPKFIPDEFEEVMGSWIDLSKFKKEV